MTGLDRLWAGWRSSYVTAASVDPSINAPLGEGGTLFERILASGRPDEESYILWRGEHCFALLNAYPYGSGHLMVLPQRAAAQLDEMGAETSAELWAGVQLAVMAVRAAYRPDGVNVGINLGTAAGAGVPDHLHVHVLPRWVADSNFTTTIAETRVLPEPLSTTWTKLRAAWPD